MKKYLILIVVVILMGAFFTVSEVQATVGGETLLYNFKYNPADESVYYVTQSYSGKGCPPSLMKLSLNSETSSIVLSCDQIFQIMQDSNNFDYSLANSEINKIVGNFNSLTPLSLKNNNISIDVNFVRAESYSPGINSILKRYFTASIYQNNKKVKEISIAGCNLDQPFTFQGYAIPGYNKRIALLLSTKGDCFEGGYTVETLYTVAGVDNLDKTITTNFVKGSSALTPNEGNLVVYKSDEVITSSMTMGQFIELLIQIGVIAPNKAAAARAIFGI